MGLSAFALGYLKETMRRHGVGRLLLAMDDASVKAELSCRLTVLNNGTKIFL